jgi:hypothetical protein
MMIFKAQTVNNLLSDEECKIILDFAKSTEGWTSGGSDFWSDRVMNDIDIYKNYDKEVGAIIHGAREKIKNKIVEIYSLDYNIYPDIMQLVRWFPGLEQPPHWDDMSKTEVHKSFQHRIFGAIVYLNDDYYGGQTFYPNYNIYIKPRPGMLAVHPGDINHIHGVTKVEKSNRYTLASFWTSDKGFDSGWPLY